MARYEHGDWLTADQYLAIGDFLDWACDRALRLPAGYSITTLVQEYDELLAQAGKADDFEWITVSLEPEALAELKRLAKARGCTIREHMRRCIALERKLFEDPAAVVTVAKSDGSEYTVRLDP